VKKRERGEKEKRGYSEKERSGGEYRGTDKKTFYMDGFTGWKRP